ncbi:MAG: Exodeoxyribonuclease V gamma chain [uncultured Solirubrobacteraceae bacterium]|uniref:RecBCD enzyme subunit RecC n=1 Tax=uncultured Solirubrobacteraceae bacterium TaxID=1162706 RepID=A0A6J4T900_9ACTN|nr:MAG: Exodeoxyribonuclease V gamma chain [uncultured Solirubrobacteraceae bacterium]
MDALRGLLRDPLSDPFAPEVIAVPTRGMERWLTQRMSTCLGVSDGRRDGVCANVGFPSPRRLVADAVAAASGIDPDADPWLVEHAVWPLLDVVEGCLEEPWLESLAAHLGAGDDARDESRRARRLSTVRHIADLFDRYAVHRPEMVRTWARSQDADGTGRPLPDGALWQAELWRRLRERIGIDSPAERLEGACARLRAEPDLVELPPRLSLFGLTRLPAGRLAVLRALAAQRDVHLFLLHPSPVLWQQIAAARAGRPAIVRRDDDVTATLPTNSLLASWGQDARELQLVVGTDDDRPDHHHPVEHGSETLLARIQSDVRADRAPPGEPLPGAEDLRPPLDRDDRSVQVHACHGRARQVEVARDAILHLLQDDANLEPRDVIVMCPDIEAFAPLIHATFGVRALLADEDDSDDAPADTGLPDLRVRLADRALRQTNPVLGVVAQLLDLTGARLTASQVLDLADRDPVRRRFGFDDDDVTRMQEWIADGGIRWGLDASHRAPFKLESLAAGTWRAGLDRLLVGVAMTEEGHRLYEGVLALDDVDSGAIDLAGRFAELVARLGAALDALGEAKTVSRWAAAIADAADALTATSPRDGWQRAELQRLLDDLAEQARAGGRDDTTSLLPAEVRALFAERLKGRPTRANFRTGHLTICTLVPMRSVPHRIVCLLGLDDGAFPRKAHRDGDDLMLADEHVGDRDTRTEDRQMLLDALLAATDRLIVTYSGNDERTNVARPPAVPVGELLDVVDRTVRVDGGGREAREQVVVRHPLQPFDPRNFETGRFVRERAWSFDRVALDGARAIVGPRAGEAPFLRAPLEPVAGPVVELDGLVRFVERPVRAFLRQRLGISVADYDEDVADALPVELDGLGVWAVGQRLVDGLIGGAELDACIAAEVARGTLPPGALSAQVIERVRPTVQDIAAQAARLLGAAGEPGSVEVSALVGDGRFLRGTAPGVRGDVLGAVTYSRVNPRHRLAAWVRLLALTASHPQRPFESVTIGRARSGAADGARVTVARIGMLGGDADARSDRALTALSRLIDVYDRGLREALPIACMTSGAYAAAARHGANPAAAARKAWESTWNYDREDREPDHLLVFGGELTIEELLRERPRADEQGDGWDASEETRFGRYARRVWDDLLACEEVVDR